MFVYNSVSLLNLQTKSERPTTHLHTMMYICTNWLIWAYGAECQKNASVSVTEIQPHRGKSGRGCVEWGQLRGTQENPTTKITRTHAERGSFWNNEPYLAMEADAQRASVFLGQAWGCWLILLFARLLIVCAQPEDVKPIGIKSKRIKSFGYQRSLQCPLSKKGELGRRGADPS